jgi:diaminohydroxyphosphoribosylaminopyrimidine deaminase/5-amino-6-(5-phosphoribosylamino)uracil reductase
MVGAVLVKRGQIIGQGWHRRAGEPHAEIEALRDAARRGHSPRGATLYVTLEPCCTHGRTPPCTEAILNAGIRRVVVGTTDPNPRHAGRGFEVLRQAGVAVGAPASSPAGLASAPKPVRAGPEAGAPALAVDCAELNEAFNHWIVHRTPLVTVKAAMTLDGKIATASGQSKWITGEKSRAFAMKLRQGSDAILVGINTVLADDPSLTVRGWNGGVRSQELEVRSQKALRRIILDSQARTPLTAKVISDEQAALTTIVVSRTAPKRRVAALAKKVRVLTAPPGKLASSQQPAAIGHRQLAIGNWQSAISHQPPLAPPPVGRGRRHQPARGRRRRSERFFPEPATGAASGVLLRAEGARRALSAEVRGGRGSGGLAANPATKRTHLAEARR